MTSTEMASPGSGAAGSVSSSPLPDAWRIEVFRRDGVDDPEGVHAQAALTELGLDGVREVRLGRGYLLPPGLDDAARERAMKEFLVDPVVDDARVTAPKTAPATKSTVRPAVEAVQAAAARSAVLAAKTEPRF